jgi:hypothetical protein
MLVPQVDIKNRRHFLKRTKYEELKPSLLYLGSTVTVFARQLKLVEYGDEYTRGKMENQSEKCVLREPVCSRQSQAASLSAPPLGDACSGTCVEGSSLTMPAGRWLW